MWPDFKDFKSEYFSSDYRAKKTNVLRGVGVNFGQTVRMDVMRRIPKHLKTPLRKGLTQVIRLNYSSLFNSVYGNWQGVCLG